MSRVWLLTGELPKYAQRLCGAGALVTGAAARNIREGRYFTEGTTDVDLVVPHARWSAVAALIPETARPNKFGGWRFEVEGYRYDVWPDDPFDYAMRALARDGGDIVIVDIARRRVITVE